MIARTPTWSIALALLVTMQGVRAQADGGELQLVVHDLSDLAALTATELGAMPGPGWPDGESMSVPGRAAEARYQSLSGIVAELERAVDEHDAGVEGASLVLLDSTLMVRHTAAAQAAVAERISLLRLAARAEGLVRASVQVGGVTVAELAAVASASRRGAAVSGERRPFLSGDGASALGSNFSPPAVDLWREGAALEVSAAPSAGGWLAWHHVAWTQAIVPSPGQAPAAPDPSGYVPELDLPAYRYLEWASQSLLLATGDGVCLRWSTPADTLELGLGLGELEQARVAPLVVELAGGRRAHAAGDLILPRRLPAGLAPASALAIEMGEELTIEDLRASLETTTGLASPDLDAVESLIVAPGWEDGTDPVGDVLGALRMRRAEPLSLWLEARAVTTEGAAASAHTFILEASVIAGVRFAGALGLVQVIPVAPGAIEGSARRESVFSGQRISGVLTRVDAGRVRVTLELRSSSVMRGRPPRAVEISGTQLLLPVLEEAELQCSLEVEEGSGTVLGSLWLDGRRHEVIARVDAAR